MSSTTEERRQNTQTEIDVGGIRDAFNMAVLRIGKPLAQVAPETGVPYGTLAAFSTAKYAGNNDRVARQVKAWLTTREAQDRAKSTMRSAPPFTMTKTASRIWEVLEYGQTMPDMVLISADAGVGKTTAINAYAASASNVWVMTAQPIHETLGGLMGLLARTLRMEWVQRAYAQAHMIQQRLTGSKGLLIIDEAQFLSPLLRDQIRSTVFDGAGIGVAFVGNEDLRAQHGRERMNGKNAQLFSRIGLRFARAKPLKDDVNTLLDAWGVDDDKARTAAMGIAMKAGANRAMAKVLVLACSMADARGDEAPNADDVETAWMQLGGQG